MAEIELVQKPPCWVLLEGLPSWCLFKGCMHVSAGETHSSGFMWNPPGAWRG